MNRPSVIKIDNAASEEEVQVIPKDIKGMVQDAGVILDDSDLDKAAGGLLVPELRGTDRN